MPGTEYSDLMGCG